MTPSPEKRPLNGWTVTVVVGSILGLLAILLSQLIADYVRQTLRDHDLLVELANRVTTVERQIAGGRVEQRIEKNELRLRAVEEELAAHRGKK